MVSLSTILGLFTGSGLFKAAKDNLLTIGVVGAIITAALMWRSDLIEKGENRAVQRIEKREQSRAKVIRSAGAKSRNDGVRGIADPNVID